MSDGAMRTTSGPAISTIEARVARPRASPSAALPCHGAFELAAEPHAFAADVGEDLAPRIDGAQAFHEQRVPRLDAVEDLGRC